MGLLRTGSTKSDGLKIDIVGLNLAKMVLKTKMERGWNGGNVHECVCVCVCVSHCGGWFCLVCWGKIGEEGEESLGQRSPESENGKLLARGKIERDSRNSALKRTEGRKKDQPCISAAAAAAAATAAEQCLRALFYGLRCAVCAVCGEKGGVKGRRETLVFVWWGTERQKGRGERERRNAAGDEKDREVGSQPQPSAVDGAHSLPSFPPHSLFTASKERTGREKLGKGKNRLLPRPNRRRRVKKGTQD